MYSSYGLGLMRYQLVCLEESGTGRTQGVGGYMLSPDLGLNPCSKHCSLCRLQSASMPVTGRCSITSWSSTQ